jgi:GTP cyclohydrolase IA
MINKHGGASRGGKKRAKPKLKQIISPDAYVVRNAIEQILHSMNVDWADENFTETPERVAKAWKDTWMSGYTMEPKQVLTTFPNEEREGDLVVVKDIPFYSMCSHHLAPFFGKGHLAYVPNGLVIGLSKPARLIEIFARRLQLQEHITRDVADSFEELVHPKGVMVILENVEHTCMTSRGVKAHGSSTTTSAVRGIFKKDSDLRNEVLSLIRS